MYHPLVTRRRLRRRTVWNVAGVAGTVDEGTRIAELAELGVDGICTNDPRLFATSLRTALQSLPPR